MLLFFYSKGVMAGDFEWIKDFNIKAEADPAGFRVRLGARFKVGEAEINTVIGKVEKPADAYMVLRLAEISAKPVDYVLNEYLSGKGKGWGVIAKNLGIKPGSKEFHALKQRDDLYGDQKVKDKGKGRGRK